MAAGEAAQRGAGAVGNDVRARPDRSRPSVSVLTRDPPLDGRSATKSASRVPAFDPEVAAGGKGEQAQHQQATERRDVAHDHLEPWRAQGIGGITGVAEEQQDALVESPGAFDRFTLSASLMNTSRPMEISATRISVAYSGMSRPSVDLRRLRCHRRTDPSRNAKGSPRESRRSKRAGPREPAS